MHYKGIIFDFNGVLLWDTHFQEEAWNEMSQALRNKPFTQEEMFTHMHGRNNSEVFGYLAGETLKEEELAGLIQRKELLYQEMCLKHKDAFVLSLGAEELLGFLVQHNIPHTIATASPKMNLDFFVKHLHLDKWFAINQIVYDDGTFAGKPAPDIYLRAATRLALEPKDCIVVEDAKSGIQAAHNAGIGHIIAIGPKQKHEVLQKLDGVKTVISTLGEILGNTSLFF